MPVVKQTYTASPPYTQSNLALLFRSAFIDAGLMTEWFDSFTSGGIDSRILEVTYDGTKTYGKTYYWFMFSGANVHMHVTTGWNASSDAPVGTQYIDFLNSSTTTTANHMQFRPFNSTVTFTITRYTSEVNPQFTWFIVRNGTVIFNLHISRTAPTASIVDLNRVFYTSAMWCETATAANTGTVGFNLFPPVLRRHYLGNSLRGVTTVGSYGAVGEGGNNDWRAGIFGSMSNIMNFYGYTFVGNANNTASNLSSGRNILLPVGFTNTNPSYATDSRPIYSGLPLSPYSSSVLPADFGISGIYTANNLEVFHQVIVTAGVEQWEVLSVANASAVTISPTAVFLARTT